MADRPLVFQKLLDFLVGLQLFDVVVEPRKRVWERLGEVYLIPVYQVVVICERELVEHTVGVI